MHEKITAELPRRHIFAIIICGLQKMMHGPIGRRGHCDYKFQY